MIEFKEVEKIHDILIEKFGGAKGIGDSGALESAINRLYQTVDGVFADGIKEMFSDLFCNFKR